MSDRPAYAKILAERLSFTNTFFHQEPFFDITAPLGARAGTCDFVISSEVFEHVAPPVERAFLGAFNLLKPGGHLILTTPFVNDQIPWSTTPTFTTIESCALTSTWSSSTGRAKVFTWCTRTLAFTVSKDLRSGSLLKCIADAGFVDVHVLSENVPEWGIMHKQSWSLPILATRPQVAADRGCRLRAAPFLV